MMQFNFIPDPKRDQLRTLGLIVLQADETIEPEFRSLIPDDKFLLHHTRIPSGRDVTPDTLAQLEADVPAAVKLLPQRTRFDVIALACTSGAATIGSDRIAALITSAHPEAQATDPLAAIKAWLRDRTISRIGLLTPYVPEVTDTLIERLGEDGVTVSSSGSFNESDEHRVARIAPADILLAIENIAASGDCEAVFVSCTNLPTLGILNLASRQIGKPVISSNSALAWHMRTLTDTLTHLADMTPDFGLFRSRTRRDPPVSATTRK